MNTLLAAVVLVIVGAAGLIWGAHLCVDNALKLARTLNASHWGVGVTVVGLATSFPEMLVSAVAAIHGKPSVGLGNALGSNITNIGVVLGVVALITPQFITRKLLVREVPLLLAIMLFSFLLLVDGSFGRWKALVLLAGMAGLLASMSRWSGHETELDRPPSTERHPLLKLSMGLLLSIVVLYFSSEALIKGAVIFADYLGVSDLIVGITIVAFGTSLPELAASVAAALRQSPEIAVGNVIGSNMFNLLGVLAMPGLFHPGQVEAPLLYRDYPFMGFITGAFYLLSADKQLSRWEGGVLLMLFIGYVATLYYFNMNPA